MKILVLTNQYPTDTKATVNPAVLNRVAGLRKLGLEVDVFFLDRIGKGISAYLSCYHPLRRKWRDGAYDLLHVHFGGIQAVFGVCIAGSRCVVTFHGTDLHGGGADSWSTNIRRKLNVCCSRQAAKKAGGVVVVSSNLIRYLPEHIAVRPRVFPPGVDYEMFRPQSRAQARDILGLKSDMGYILFSDISGSPVKRRDIAHAVEKIVQQKHCRAELLILTEEPHWRVPLYLNAADCLLLVSDREGSPNIVKEALAVNLPIVSVDVGDVAMRCQGVPNCRIVERDAQVLAEAVVHALQRGRGVGGRHLKRSEIDDHVICKRVRNYYYSLLGKRSDNRD